MDDRVERLRLRILAGEAEPISDRERDQLRFLRDAYVRRFGVEPRHTVAQRR